MKVQLVFGEEDQLMQLVVEEVEQLAQLVMGVEDLL